MSEEKIENESLMEVFNDKPKENETLNNIDSGDLIKNIHKSAIVSEVKNNDSIKEKFIDQAGKSVDAEMKKIDSENTTKVQKAVYDANKEACRCYGIEDAVPTWQTNLMKIGHGFWFVIYFVFASFTFCPVNVFIKGIRSFIKNAWLSVLIGILCYCLITIGIPVLISYLNSKGIKTIINK